MEEKKFYFTQWQHDYIVNKKFIKDKNNARAFLSELRVKQYFNDIYGENNVIHYTRNKDKQIEVGDIEIKCPIKNIIVEVKTSYTYHDIYLDEDIMELCINIKHTDKDNNFKDYKQINSTGTSEGWGYTCKADKLVVDNDIYNIIFIIDWKQLQRVFINEIDKFIPLEECIKNVHNKEYHKNKINDYMNITITHDNHKDDIVMFIKLTDSFFKEYDINYKKIHYEDVIMETYEDIKAVKGNKKTSNTIRRSRRC